MLNITHSRYKGQPFAYVSRVTTVRPSVMGALQTEWWRAINTQTETAQYALGKLPARHPVPAIPQCSWCGSKYDGSPCTYNETGEWCPDFCIYF